MSLAFPALRASAHPGTLPPLGCRVGTAPVPGAALVLLHGLGESSVGWRRVMQELSTRYEVIAIDLPGFGRSPALPGGAHLQVPVALLTAAAVIGIGVLIGISAWGPR